jgi:hypothetical protein
LDSLPDDDKTDTTKFQDLYMNKIREQILKNKRDLLLEFSSIQKFMHQEIKIKSDMLEYQKYILETQGTWMTYTDQKINEQVLLIEELDTMVSTQQRISGFGYEEMDVLQKWVKVITPICILLILLAIGLVVYTNYSEAKALANQAIEKMTEIGETVQGKSKELIDKAKGEVQPAGDDETMGDAGMGDEMEDDEEGEED